jgi:hypothetical protein
MVQNTELLLTTHSKDEYSQNTDMRWICGHTRRDRIRNDDIQDKLRVTPIQKKLVQRRLR